MAATTPHTRRNFRFDWVRWAHACMFVSVGAYLTMAIANSVWWRLPQSERGSAGMGLFGSVMVLALLVAMPAALAGGAAAVRALAKGEPVARVVFPLLLGGIHAFMLLTALPVLVFGR